MAYTIHEDLNRVPIKSVIEVSKKVKIRNRYNQVPLLTQDTKWESDKNTTKYRIEESQDFSPFPAGHHKATINRQESMNTTKHKYQKGSTKDERLGMVSKIFLLEILN